MCFFIIFILSEWVPRRQPVVLRTEKQGFQSRWAFFLDRYAQQLNRTKITSPDKHEILLEKAELYSRVLKEAQDSHWAIIKLPAETIILYMPFRLSKDAKARAKCWSLTLRIKVDFRVKLEQSFRVMLACQLRVWLFFCLEWTKREYRTIELLCVIHRKLFLGCIYLQQFSRQISSTFSVFWIAM